MAKKLYEGSQGKDICYLVPDDDDLGAYFEEIFKEVDEVADESRKSVRGFTVFFIAELELDAKFTLEKKSTLT